MLTTLLEPGAATAPVGDAYFPGKRNAACCCPGGPGNELMSGYQTIRYQRQGDIGNLTLARPGKLNAQNPLMWEELARLGTELLP